MSLALYGLQQTMNPTIKRPVIFTVLSLALLITQRALESWLRNSLDLLLMMVMVAMWQLSITSRGSNQRKLRTKAMLRWW